MRECLTIANCSMAGLDNLVGRDHHYSLACAVNLASDLAALGRVEEARELGRDTLERLRRLFKSSYPLLLACMTNHALHVAASGFTTEAEELMEKAWRSYAGSMTVDHPDARLALVERVRMNCDFDSLPI